MTACLTWARLSSADLSARLLLFPQVAQEVIPIYKQLISKATVITPNQFEAEIFADVKITTLASLKTALESFHTTYGLPNVVISSLSLPRAELEHAGIALPKGVEGDNFLICAGSSKLSASDPAKAFVITFPKLEEHYEGPSSSSSTGFS